MCKVALVGNPNCGKSTIFNRLTNSNAKVGNRAGVTVSVEQAKIAKTDVTLCDLAGFYSLDAFTAEEQLSVAFLSNVKKVINVVDCTRLERSLHLTNQLVANGFDVMVALTMCDEASKLGLNISTEQLENKFNIPFVKIQANIGLGLEKLCQFATTPPKNAPKPVPNVAKVLKDANVNTPLITMQKADKLLLGKFAFVFLALILLAIFFLAVGGIAQFLTNSINNLGDVVKKIFENTLFNSFAPVWQSLLLCVCDSVFLVLSFTPQIVVLFLLLTLLEDTGYMARISFLCDKPLSTLGLSGHSAISLLLATGCAVFAITSTRTIKNNFERETLCALAPQMPCSAKTLLVGLFASQFRLGWIWLGFYLVAIVSIFFGGKILNVFSKRDNSLFAFEMPPYRMPDLWTATKLMAKRAFEFIEKAFLVIVPASVVAWVLSNFTFGFACTNQLENSILAEIGKFFAPLFAPLGFGKWQFVASTLCGLTAKETIISTLQVLGTTLNSLSFEGAFCFVCFNLTTIPCLATVFAIAKELGVFKTIKTVAFQFVFSWSFCCVLHFLLKIGWWTAPLVAVAAFLFNKKGNRTCDCLKCNKCKKSLNV